MISILPVYFSYKILKTLFAAATSLMLGSQTTVPEYYHMMNVYPMEISSEAEAALLTERLFQPVTEFFGCGESLSSNYQPWGVTFYKALNEMDTEWFASIYQWMQLTPDEAAARLGLAQAVGVPCWENINLRLQDGTGVSIGPSSNAKEILSMASIYTGFVDREDTDLFQTYISSLWQVSHTLQVEISPVYYCDGCKRPEENSSAAQDTISAATPGEAEKAAEASLFSEEAGESSDCPGHVDLNITAQICGLEGNPSLYTLDTIGAQDSGLWSGWTEENRAAVRRLCESDWQKLYGLEPYEPCIGTPLSAEEIRGYLSQLPEDLSPERKQLIETALHSVGRIPYYYGGKTNHPGYEQNHFASPVSPDKKGRNLSGLDCSGWIHWIYLTATGTSAVQQSTQTLANSGRAVTASELKPGDIVVRIGAAAEEEDGTVGSHAAMFLSWNPDGTMNIIHETGMPVNNVTVSSVSADWPYMRSFLE